MPELLDRWGDRVGVALTDLGGSVDILSAFVQVNDLVGSTGSGMLNLKAGIWEVAMPFLSSWRCFLTRKLPHKLFFGGDVIWCILRLCRFHAALSFAADHSYSRCRSFHPYRAVCKRKMTFAIGYSSVCVM